VGCPLPVTATEAIPDGGFDPTSGALADAAGDTSMVRTAASATISRRLPRRPAIWALLVGVQTQRLAHRHQFGLRLGQLIAWV
jgi:hypothetical protein